jgi:hypothetical protein
MLTEADTGSISRAGDLILRQLGEMTQLVHVAGRGPLTTGSWRYRRLKNRFGLFNEIGKPLHATGYQRRWCFFHGLDRRPQACLPRLQIGNQVW